MERPPEAADSLYTGNSLKDGPSLQPRRGPSPPGFVVELCGLRRHVSLPRPAHPRSGGLQPTHALAPDGESPPTHAFARRDGNTPSIKFVSGRTSTPSVELKSTRPLTPMLGVITVRPPTLRPRSSCWKPAYPCLRTLDRDGDSTPTEGFIRAGGIPPILTVSSNTRSRTGLGGCQSTSTLA